MNSYQDKEVLVIDGMSTDDTKELVNWYSRKYPYIHLINNPQKTAPIALNIGIKEAKGDIIIRMDAHATYDKDYISECVRLLETTDAQNVGGMQSAVGLSYMGEAIAIAMTTPFGVGNSYFRYGKEARYVDTVYLGAWKKSTLEMLGGFNEEWIVNQDYELNYRLRKKGGKILFSPSIKCQYYVRSSLRKLAKQYFRYGFWKVKTIKAHPKSLVLRQLVPPVFVSACLLSLALLPFIGRCGTAIPLLYTLLNIGASVITAKKRGLKYLPILPLVFTALHFSWGIGFISGTRRLSG